MLKERNMSDRTGGEGVVRPSARQRKFNLRKRRGYQHQSPKLVMSTRIFRLQATWQIEMVSVAAMSFGQNICVNEIWSSQGKPESKHRPSRAGGRGLHAG